MFFRKMNVRCIECARFVPSKDNPRRGTCHIIEIADATLACDCRWFESLNEKDAEPAKQAASGKSGTD